MISGFFSTLALETLKSLTDMRIKSKFGEIGIQGHAMIREHVQLFRQMVQCVPHLLNIVVNGAVLHTKALLSLLMVCVYFSDCFELYELAYCMIPEVQIPYMIVRSM